MAPVLKSDSFPSTTSFQSVTGLHFLYRPRFSAQSVASMQRNMQRKTFPTEEIANFPFHQSRRAQHYENSIRSINREADFHTSLNAAAKLWVPAVLFERISH